MGLFAELWKINDILGKLSERDKKVFFSPYHQKLPPPWAAKFMVTLSTILYISTHRSPQSRPSSVIGPAAT